MWYSVNYATKNPSPKKLHEYMDKQYGKNKGGVWLNVKLNFNDDFQEVEFEDMGGAIELNEI